MWKTTILLDKGSDFSDFKTFDNRLNSPFITDSNATKEKLLLQYIDQVLIENHELQYLTPNNVAIFFSLAQKSSISGKHLFTEIKKRARANSHNNKFERKILISDSTLVCDFLEQIQTAIVFSFTAIESFINLSIPKEYIYTLDKKQKKELYNKEQIERWIGWKEKISKILVEIYDTAPVENQPFWSRFTQLVDLRNKIVHQKSSNDTEFLELLFNNNIFQVCLSANELFCFFIENSLNKFNSDTEMVGNEHLWPGVVTYIPEMLLKVDSRDDISNNEDT